MGRTAGAIWRIAVRGQHHLGIKGRGALDRVVEIIDLEPEATPLPNGRDEGSPILPWWCSTSKR
jgi:hypothetical protein